MPDMPIDAAFAGGNWAFEYLPKANKKGVNVRIDEDYFNFLKKEGVQWVGVSVGMFLDNVQDDTVHGNYSHKPIPNNPAQLTMTDANLKYVLTQFEKHGINTYLTTAFENSASGSSPPRWLFGKTYDQDVANFYSQDEWKWDVNNPDHQEFVENFWTSYTNQIEHYAKIAEKTGVDMLSLGTETDSLFHAGTTPASQQDFTSYIDRMIAGARENYSGLLTYDQHYSAAEANDFYEARDFWDNFDLDVIGISAYFQLLDQVSGVSTVTDLKEAWRRVFTDTLSPMQQANPEKSIVFTEFGYTDSINSPVQANADEFQKHVFADTNHNGRDDGQETQANIYKAFFAVNREFGGLVKAVFLWDSGGKIVDDDTYDSGYGKLTTFAIRGKLAEKVIAHEYQVERSGADQISDAASDHFVFDSHAHSDHGSSLPLL